MRLGQILVGAGVVDAEQVSAALRQQVVYGGRLGTNVIELGYADADQIARALAKQHGVPAALRRHLERHDPSVLGLLPVEHAAALFAFPVAYSLAGGVRRLVVCMRDPVDAGALATIRAHAGIDTVPCAAPELLVYALLDRFYGIARPRRMAHAQHGHARPLPGSRTGPVPVQVPDDDSVDIDFESDESTEMSTLQLVELDDAGVVKDLSQYSPTGSARTTASAIAGSIWASASAIEGAGVASAATAAAEKAMAAASAGPPSTAADLQEPAVVHSPRPAEETELEPPHLELGAALAAIDRAEHRDGVSTAVVGYMRGVFGGGLVLLAKDGLALGADGFGGHFDADSVQSIVVPLSVPSAFQKSHDDGHLYRGMPPAAGKAIQDRFFKLFPLEGNPAEIAIAPVVIGNRVVCLYYAHAAGGGALNDTAVIGLGQLADRASQAYVRLIRGAKRSS